MVLKTRVLTTTPTVTTVGVTGPAQVLAHPLTEAARGLGRITIQHVSSPAVGESLVRSGQLDVLVTGSPLSPQVLVKDQLNATLQAALTGLVKQEALSAQLTARGLNPRTVAAAVAHASIHIHSLTPPSAGTTQRLVLALIVGVVLFVSLQTYGLQVAQGVAEEKESRIVEILLATLRPGQLLLGKVVGIGLVGLLQLAIIGAVALILIERTHVVTIPAFGAGDIAGGLLWFVLGFSLYAILFAAAGSLVSRLLTTSSPSSSPRPRTSPMHSCRDCSCRSPCASRSPATRARSTRPSRSTTSSTFSPTAAGSGSDTCVV